jgi:hypothetical protein
VVLAAGGTRAPSGFSHGHFFDPTYSVSGGIDASMGLLLGRIGFFTFSRPAFQVMPAVAANRALFAYRQVSPAIQQTRLCVCP